MIGLMPSPGLSAGPAYWDLLYTNQTGSYPNDIQDGDVALIVAGRSGAYQMSNPTNGVTIDATYGWTETTSKAGTSYYYAAVETFLVPLTNALAGQAVGTNGSPLYAVFRPMRADGTPALQKIGARWTSDKVETVPYGSEPEPVLAAMSSMKSTYNAGDLDDYSVTFDGSSVSDLSIAQENAVGVIVARAKLSFRVNPPVSADISVGVSSSTAKWQKKHQPFNARLS